MLLSLGKKYGTDKVQHKYIKYYEKIFEPIKDLSMNILEIGVREGYSHLLWKEYFKNSKIYGIDNYSDPVFKKNIKTYDHLKDIIIFIGNQEDENFLNNNINFNLDILIDDGGHEMEQQQSSLKYLFKKITSQGYYIIEDLHTSINPKNISKYGKFTTLNFLKNIMKLTDENSLFIKGEDLKYIQDNILNINIYNNKLCIIQKK
uniref:Class I SAM-dependent methyltransferase n=1 Tax=viral metagenome TaxID=1070528 RepID=A0A6C0F7Q3_9ZZZZ|tara:strand:- start:1433 stop:2044 length:612 start_codon:yes stop_codon:yes gene_type:complete